MSSSSSSTKNKLEPLLDPPLSESSNKKEESVTKKETVEKTRTIRPKPSHSSSKLLLQFPDDMESPIWDRKTIPTTHEKDPECELKRNNSKWLYNRQGSMVVVKAQYNYSFESGGSFNYLTKKREPNLHSCTWSIKLYSGVFALEKDWTWERTSSILIYQNEDKFASKGYQWLDGQLDEIVSMPEHEQQPLWIFIEDDNPDDIGVDELQHHISRVFKSFLESKKPMFVVPLEFEAPDEKKKNKHQSVFNRSGFEVISDVYENPAATLCFKTCKIEKWEPVKQIKERPLKWKIEIYPNKDDYDDLEFPISKLQMETPCLMESALEIGFQLHAEKYPLMRVSAIITCRRDRTMVIIQKNHTRQNPRSGTLQLYYFMLNYDSVKTRYENLYRNARPQTRAVVDKIVENATSSNDLMNFAMWRRVNKIMQVKKEIDDLMPKVTVQNQELAVIKLSKAKRDPEELWLQVLVFLKKSYLVERVRVEG
jgi:hypothetical protein